MDHQDEQQDKQMASQDSHHFITEDDLQVVTGGGAQVSKVVLECCGLYTSPVYDPNHRYGPRTAFSDGRPTEPTPPSSPKADTELSSSVTHTVSAETIKSINKFDRSSGRRLRKALDHKLYTRNFD